MEDDFSDIEMIDAIDLMEIHALSKPLCQWGNWKFIADNLTLLYREPGCFCEIDLEEIQTSAHIADWIFQVAGKPWASSEAVHSLIQAFTQILDPQANYCSCGKSKSCDGSRLAKEYRKRLKSDTNANTTRSQ